MTIADDLASLATEIAAGKASLDVLTTRLMNTHGDQRTEVRREQGRLAGHVLSLRLAFLYKIEDAWPQVLAALRGPFTEGAASRWRLVSEQPESEEALFVVRDADGQCAFAVRYEGKWEHTADADCGPIAEWFALPPAPCRSSPGEPILDHGAYQVALPSPRNAPKSNGTNFVPVAAASTTAELVNICPHGLDTRLECASCMNNEGRK